MPKTQLEKRRELVKKHFENNTLDVKTKKAIAKKFKCPTEYLYNDLQVLARTEFGYPMYPTKTTKELIHKRDMNKCQYCGKKHKYYKVKVIEHVVPLIKSGFGAEFNLVSSCDSCNKKKGSEIWIPRNIHVLIDLNQKWGEKILDEASKDKRQMYKRKI